MLAGELAAGWEMREGKPFLKTRSAQTGGEREIAVDAVVAGIGIQPNDELAKAAGLEVDNGIRVDRGLRTSHPDIYAAGDVANFYNPALDQRLRVEHEDNANTMGRLAGQAMAGRKVSYDHLPSFYSDLFELGFEAVGEVDAQLETVADWKEPYRKGVVYYLREGRVHGVPPEEVTFHEVRDHLGVETQRQWSDLAIARTTPCLLGLFSIVTLLGTRVSHHASLWVSATAWYHKKRPTFSDTLAAVRRQVWCEQGFLASRGSSELAKLQPALRDGIIHALCHAA